jgi:hypothetical protein
MFAMKKNIVNDAKRKMIAITFLVLFMVAIIGMSGKLQSEINNRPDRAPVQTVEVSSDDVEEIEIIEIIQINEPPELYLAMRY